MTSESFDDQPQWYWAARRDMTADRPAGDGFLIACGQRELWRRVRAEINPERHCGWLAFGHRNGEVSIADCFIVFITAREQYGADYNRVLMELAQVPVFAKFVRDTGRPVQQLVSNPITSGPITREPYSSKAADRLERIVEETIRSAREAR